MKYKTVVTGEWVRPQRRGYKFACCDCGLVHRLDFRLIRENQGKRVEFRAFRDNRATGQIRRHI